MQSWMIACGVLFGQELEFHQLSDRIPIPASECYNIIQDKDGFIWFATEAGYCRYHRGGIDIFDSKKGIPERAVYAAALDEKGVLYVITSELRLLYFDGHQFVESSFSKKYKEAAGIEWSFPSALKFCNNKIFIYEISRTCVIDRSTGNIDYYGKADNTIHFTINENGEILFESFRGKTYHGLMDKMIFEFANHKKYSCKAEFVGNSTPAYVTSFRNNVAVAHLQSIWVFKDGQIIGHKKFNSRILSVKFDSDGNLLIGFLNEGLYRYQKADLSSVPLVSLKNMSISGILPASDHSIWCTTLENGVYFCPNPQITSFRNNIGLDQKINLLNVCDGKLLAASPVKGIYQINTNPAKLFLPLSTPKRVNNILKFKEYYIICSEQSELASIKTGKSREYWNSVSYLATYNAFAFSDECVFVNNNSVEKFNPLILKQPLTNPHKAFDKKRARNALLVNDSVILIYGKELLLLFDGKNDRFLKKVPNNLHLNSAVLSMDGNIYFSTKEEGIYRYSIQSNQLEKVFRNNTDQIFFCIDQDRTGRYWIGTNTGVLVADRNWKDVRDYSQEALLPRVEITSIKYYHDTIYIGSHDGLYSLPIAYIPPGEKPQSPKIDYFLNNKIHYDTALPAGWFGDVTVKLLIPALSNNMSVFYRIADGSFSGPIQIDGEQLTFSQLNPGVYHVEVFVKSDSGQLSNPLLFTFQIAPKFYQTTWFRILMVIAFLFIVLLVSLYIIRLIKKREEKKTEINLQLAEFQMSALQAQMNPHFIFNAINTIQSYILTKNKEEAYKYLNKFSNLIRLVLHHSQEKLITLHEELEVIETYLELEHARFSSFDYEINISEEIDIHEVQIPPMVIQPYLENAIWHGLNNLTDRRGKLVLDFFPQDDYLVIKVEDNGIGREESAKHRKTMHKSVGLKLTQKRIEMLKTLFEEGEAIVEVIDNKDEQGATGTIIIVKIPLF